MASQNININQCYWSRSRGNTYLIQLYIKGTKWQPKCHWSLNNNKNLNNHFVNLLTLALAVNYSISGLTLITCSTTDSFNTITHSSPRVTCLGVRTLGIAPTRQTPRSQGITIETTCTSVNIGMIVCAIVYCINNNGMNLAWSV